MAHIRQSIPDSGLGFQAKVLTTFEVIPSSLGRTTTAAHIHGPSTFETRATFDVRGVLSRWDRLRASHWGSALIRAADPARQLRSSLPSRKLTNGWRLPKVDDVSKSCRLKVDGVGISCLLAASPVVGPMR